MFARRGLAAVVTGTQPALFSNGQSFAKRLLSVELTDRAKERILALRKQKNQPNLMLRLAVEGGGCSGFSYKFSTFDGEPEKEDLLVGGDPPLVIDPASLEFVKGSKVDFTEDLIRRSFEVVNNPQVDTKCGCGASFSPKTMKKSSHKAAASSKA